MKKLILILLTITLLSSCGNLWTDKTDGTLIVQTVELYNNANYKYRISFVDNNIDYYTNTKYSIGDTLQLKSLHH